MKWKVKVPKHGERRIRSKFLIFPKLIDGDCRWLERSYYIEEYEISNVMFQDCAWKPIKWVSEEDYHTTW